MLAGQPTFVPIMPMCKADCLEQATKDYHQIINSKKLYQNVFIFIFKPPVIPLGHENPFF